MKKKSEIQISDTSNLIHQTDSEQLAQENKLHGSYKETALY